MSRHVQDYLPEIDFFFETSCESDMQREMHTRCTQDQLNPVILELQYVPTDLCPRFQVQNYPLNVVFVESTTVCGVKISSGDLCLKMKITLLTFRVNQSKQQLVPRRVLKSTNSASLIFPVAQAEIHMFTIFQCSS